MVKNKEFTQTPNSIKLKKNEEILQWEVGIPMSATMATTIDIDIDTLEENPPQYMQTGYCLASPFEGFYSFDPNQQIEATAVHFQVSTTPSGSIDYVSYDPTQLRSIFFSSPSIPSNFNKIQFAVSEELKNYSHYLPNGSAMALSRINALIGQLSAIPFEEVIAELTPSQTIKIKFKLDAEKIISVTKPLDSQQERELGVDMVIFTLFIDGNAQFIRTVNIKKVINFVQKLMSE
ncbi:MAG: hypothetical protein AAF990_14710 [Bacteroidota bacterium]